MKLIFCPPCQDMVKLQRSERSCYCGKSWGQYTDHIKATIGGEAIAVGIDNLAFTKALRGRIAGTYIYSSLEFDAFIFGEGPRNITKEP